MTIRISLVLGMTIVLAPAAGLVTGQTQPWRASNVPGRSAVPPQQQRQQPLQLQQPRHPGARRPAPPFVLTPEQQSQVDRVLQAWQRRTDGIRTFEAKFTRREYDPVNPVLDSAGVPKYPNYTEEGMLKYAKPDKGMFQIYGKRPVQWICDGKSIHEFSYVKKQLIEYPLPPEMRGKAIADGPLPFLFGSTAEKLKRRYFIRLLQPPPGARDQVWLEAYPRFQRDAADFKRAELIINTKDWLPAGIQTHSTNGTGHISYSFHAIVVNDPNPLRFLMGDPFRPKRPTGWTKIVEPVRQTAGKQPASGNRR